MFVQKGMFTDFGAGLSQKVIYLKAEVHQTNCLFIRAVMRVW